MMTSSKQALELARKAFQEYLSTVEISSEDLHRLSWGIQQDGADWLVDVTLHDASALISDKGLAADLLENASKPVLSIRIEGATGAVVVTDHGLFPSRYPSS